MRILLIFGIFFSTFLYSQEVIEKPNSASKSHNTLIIDKIERSKTETIVYLTIENQVENGWVCIDKKIYLQNSSGGEKYFLLQNKFIPTCPEVYHFSYSSEKLSFVLYFPPIPASIEFLDMVENCNNACFSFEGIILDKKFNAQIEEAHKIASYDSEGALKIFSQLISQYPKYPFAIWHFYCATLCNELRRPEETKKWIQKLRLSNCRDKEKFLKILEKK